MTKREKQFAKELREITKGLSLEEFDKLYEIALWYGFENAVIFYKTKNLDHLNKDIQWDADVEKIK